MTAALVLGALVAAAPASPATASPATAAPAPLACVLAGANSPDYYSVSLVPTRQVTGTGRASGVARASFERTPFGVEVAPDGNFKLTLDVDVTGLPDAADGAFVAWVSTPDLDEARPLGTLDSTGSVSGVVAWNKFLVFVTLEPAEGPDAAADRSTWTGPVILRGMSRSGRMHTMAGHGPFEQQECSVYGY